MPIAALLDPLVNLCTDFIGSVGYAGVFVLTMLGSACIPIPSEATMLFAGFKVSDGDHPVRRDRRGGHRRADRV
jgi:membrane protein DedA with SNARE-associated domain